MSLPRPITALCLAGGLFLTVHAASAHDDLINEIERVTQQIASSSSDASLYLRRGELRRLHEEWEFAAADYDRAAALNPRLTMVDLCRGRMFLDRKDPEQAKQCLDRYLAQQPSDASGYAFRGQAQVEMEAYVAAAGDYSRAIDLASEADPEHYLPRANALAMAGEFDAAVRGLDEGIARLGSVVSLVSLAIELEVKAGRGEAALARLEKIMAESARKETWLTKRGDILRAGGRNEEAAAAYEGALRAIAALPDERRRTRTVESLEAETRAKLAQLTRP